MMTDSNTNEEITPDLVEDRGGGAAETDVSATAGADAGAEATEPKADDGPTSMLDAVSEAVDKLDEAKAEEGEAKASEDEPPSSGDEQDRDAAPASEEPKAETPKEEDPGHFSRKEWKSLAPKTRERIEWFRQQRLQPLKGGDGNVHRC